jgi:LL-diaminopimelate aminotransferase
MFAIEDVFAERIGGRSFGKDSTIYKFEKIKRAKRAAVKEHPEIDLLDMGVGEPDERADDIVVEALAREAKDPANRGYADNGILEFQQAAAAWLQKIYGLGGIDPAGEIIHSIGSKPALAMLAHVFINPGDVALMTVPGYPVFGTYARYLGGEVYALPLRSENNFLPDLASLPQDICKRAKVLVLNYPNNPTGRGATEAFFSEAVAFAKEHGIVIIHDAAYSALTYGRKPLAFLSAPGAKEVGLEIFSLSKAFNMTGWRMAFVAGRRELVAAYGNVKDNTDSGQFIAIQKAAAAALAHPEITERTRLKYERRLGAMVTTLQGLGFDAAMPDGSFFLFVRAPKGSADGREFASGEDFSQFLIREKMISSVPFDDVGNFIRFSATFAAKDEADEKRVLAEFAHRLEGMRLIF